MSSSPCEGAKPRIFPGRGTAVSELLVRRRLIKERAAVEAFRLLEHNGHNVPAGKIAAEEGGIGREEAVIDFNASSRQRLDRSGSINRNWLCTHPIFPLLSNQ